MKSKEKVEGARSSTQRRKKALEKEAEVYTHVHVDCVCDMVTCVVCDMVMCDMVTCDVCLYSARSSTRHSVIS